MNTPKYLDAPFVDKNGRLTPEWRTIMMQLLQQLKGNFNSEGILVPSQTTANIAKFATQNKNSNIVYDEEKHGHFVTQNGVVKELKTV